MNTYQLQLQSKKWKSKRLKIFKRDDFKCTVCGSKERLNVHHTFYYHKRIKAWLYPDASLITVCEDCHLKYHQSVEVPIKKAEPKPKKKVKDKKYNKLHNEFKKNIKSIPSRVCWNCDNTNNHLKNIEYPIYCLECKNIYYLNKVYPI